MLAVIQYGASLKDMAYLESETASICPRSTDWIEPRKISVIYAPLWIAKAMAPAQKGVKQQRM